MKILCISDDTDPLIYSKNIKTRMNDVDLIISAGDLPLKYYEYIVSMTNKDLYFVFGNHNLENMRMYIKDVGPSYASDDQTLFCGGQFIDGKLIYDKKHDLIIGGLGGSNRYNRGKHQFTDGEMKARMRKWIPRLIWNRLVHGRSIDILVTHAPPYGLNDDIDACHRGFPSFLTFMRKYKPKYLLHGHVHLTDLNQPREVVYGQTKIINIYQRYMLNDPYLGKKK